MAQQAGLDVLGRQRLGQQRVVQQVDLADREVVRCSPIRVDQGELVGEGRRGRGLVSVLICVIIGAGRISSAVSVRITKRKFTTTSADLLVLADWLGEHGITRVGMESTADYWRPVLYCWNTASTAGYSTPVTCAPCPSQDRRGTDL
jgi:hypothetical protein